MPTIEEQFEREHLRNLGTYQQQVEQDYLDAITEIFQVVAITTFAADVFQLNNYPVLKSSISAILQRWRDKIYSRITQGIVNEYGLSSRKAGATIETAYGQVNPVIRERFTAPGNPTAFIERHVRRLTLSDRVWKLHRQFYSEIEKNLFAGIAEGKSAQQMARDMKRFLKEPDQLFRRVRDAEGRLVLSETAKKFQPGQGVYRSSFKNALRLTAHETNRAYRTADHERWKNTPFVLGVEVKLSRSHPTYDMCDLLVGPYPPDYKHTGFHIRCLCYSVPILPTVEQFKGYQQAILEDKEAEFRFDKIKEVPASAKQWVLDNAEKMENWKAKPLFIQDNPKYIQRVLAK